VRPTLTTLSETRVRSYTSKTLISVRPETPLADVYELLLDRQVLAVPVIDHYGTLAGILSSRDLLREAQIELLAPGEVARITPPPRLARDLMRRSVVTVDEDQPLTDAARKMTENRIHCVVVTRAGAPVGVVTTRDAMRAVLYHRLEAPLAQVMTTPVETIEQGETIRSAIERLADADVRGLVVVDGSWPIGVFTHTEAMQARALPSMFLDTPVERVMSYETICLDVQTPVYRVAGHALQMHVRRILAVHARELRGIVSGFDLARVLTT
jgi:predicted transcriptional regulator